MSENKVFDSLNVHFGKELAARIYACALIMKDNSPKLAGADDEQAVRYTLGALKRNRARDRRRMLTWLEAVERMESEQDEGRHYGLNVGGIDRDIVRIEAINKHGYEDAQGQHIATGAERNEAAHKAIAMMSHAIVAQQEAQAADIVDSIEVRAWVASYMANISRTKLSFIQHVLADINEGRGIARRDAQNITMRYAPKGVGAVDFMELIARHA